MTKFFLLQPVLGKDELELSAASHFNRSIPPKRREVPVQVQETAELHPENAGDVHFLSISVFSSYLPSTFFFYYKIFHRIRAITPRDHILNS